MDVSAFITFAAVFVHTHVAFLSVAFLVVALATLFGDAEDLILLGLDKGWRSLLSINLVLATLASDAANATAFGVGFGAFYLVVAGGGSFRDAGLAAVVAIGTVNTGFLFGADREKLGKILALAFKHK